MVLLHEWTKLPGLYKDESGQRYTVYECEHCHASVNHYGSAIWQESMEDSHILPLCAGFMSVDATLFAQPLTYGTA